MPVQQFPTRKKRAKKKPATPQALTNYRLQQKAMPWIEEMIRRRLLTVLVEIPGPIVRRSNLAFGTVDYKMLGEDNGIMLAVDGPLEKGYFTNFPRSMRLEAANNPKKLDVIE